ncbi:unnamed protein product [Trichogramma brassicae]|uniref:RNA-directed DNA polymerase n=1 Tax=Trichogramma brassicae TaxID=86971 RepID=A0A6H5IQB4_9HYME|nr:unnamed protein product [Trichogramma brassicae]
MSARLVHTHVHVLCKPTSDSHCAARYGVAPRHVQTASLLSEHCSRPPSCFCTRKICSSRVPHATTFFTCNKIPTSPQSKLLRASSSWTISSTRPLQIVSTSTSQSNEDFSASTFHRRTHRGTTYRSSNRSQLIDCDQETHRKYRREEDLSPRPTARITASGVPNVWLFYSRGSKQPQRRYLPTRRTHAVDDRKKNPPKKRPRESSTPIRDIKRPAGERSRKVNTLLGVKNPVAPSNGTRSTRSTANASISGTRLVEQRSLPTSEEAKQQLPPTAPEEDEQGPSLPTSEEAEQQPPPTAPEEDEQGGQPTPSPRRNYAMDQQDVFNFEELARALLSARPAVPTFSGLDHEDPDKYLEKCQAFITGQRLQAEQQVPTLQEGLQGEAKKWWLPYQIMELDYERYSQLIKSKWAADNNRTSLLAKLYGEKQEPDESVTTFLQKKYLLYQRLRKGDTEQEKRIPFVEQEEAMLDFRRRVLHVGRDRRTTAALIGRHSESEAHTPLPSHGFPEEYNEEVRKLLTEFRHVLAPDGLGEGTNSAQHVIRLSTKKPFRKSPYRYSEETRKEIERQVQEMLANGIIEPSDSPYNSPIVMAKKKGGKLRFCVDYRQLNEISIDQAQQIPLISDSLKDLGDATIFSTLDLKSGYWQIPMEKNSKPYTAFTTPTGGTYQFRFMPFGLQGAAGTFQKLMSQEVLAGYLNKFCLVYLDDIVVYSKSWEEHIHHLTRVLERLSIHKLKCATEKIHLGTQNIEYLGFIVNAEGNEVKPSYAQAIIDTPPPRSKKELQSFVRACNWLREYVPELAVKMAPLTDLMKAARGFVWTKTAQAAFENVKAAFEQPLRLARPRSDMTFVLQTDASARGMGAVLYQQGEESEDRRIIAYASAKFSTTESRYHCNEQECLAVVWAVKRFRPYLEDRPFILRTDNRTITWLHRFKNTKDKLTRWALLLQEFSFKIEHCPGRHNELPDLLSRNPQEDTPADLSDVDRIHVPEYRRPASDEIIPQLGLFTMSEDPVEWIRTAQRDDAELQAISESSQVRRKEGLVWRKKPGTKIWRIIVPASAREELMREHHEADTAGHPGANETLRRLQKNYTWSGIMRDTRDYVRSCTTCKEVKKNRTPPYTQSAHKPTKPWDTVALDLMGPYPATADGCRHLLVITDLFSRWVEIFPVASTDATTIADRLEKEVFTRWGFPRAILTDNGTQFTSKAWATACKTWQAAHWTTAVYWPQANPTERRNQEIKTALRTQLKGRPHTEWDKHLPKILFQLRCRKNAATGKTPAEVLLGRELLLPGEWKFPRPFSDDREAEFQSIREHQERYQATYASDRGDVTPSLRVGEMVYIKASPFSKSAKNVCASLDVPWEGPYPVQRVVKEGIYVIGKGKGVTTHISRIKPTEEKKCSRTKKAIAN